MQIELTRKQKTFIDATADEVLYGGAAGGGKSYGQIVDAMLYALKYPRSKQLILRRTFPELNMTLIRTALELYPQGIFTYSQATRTGRFANGSIIDFGYCDAENDVLRYQGGEYDVIRFDELTHFTEYQYLYLMSRLRGANDYPKMMKSTTNPGGIGHSWVKERFIDPAPPCEEFGTAAGTRRVYIPATVHDNIFLMRKDPDYIRRLENLPEKQRKALLDGNWDIFDGIRFTAFDRAVHVVSPFTVPRNWRRYVAIDYGLDRLAALWIAVDDERGAWIYKEFCESNLIISDAAKGILERCREEEVYCTLAPDDLWARGQESGKSRAYLFADCGLPLVKVMRDRPAGWAAIDELLKTDGNGKTKLHIFENCTEIIRCLPLLQIDQRKPDDVMTEPHDITHAPDALRSFAVYWTNPNAPAREEGTVVWRKDQWEDYYHGTAEEREMMIQQWGKPKR